METPRTTRIAFVIGSLAAGSDEPPKAWMTWLAGRGHDVTAVPLTTAPAQPELADALRVRAEVAVAGSRKRAAALAALIGGERFDAVIGVRTGPNNALLAAAKRLPRAGRPLVVITEHAPLSLYLASATPSRRRDVRVARRLYRTADLAVSASHPIAAELTAAFGVPASRSLIVPRPVITADDLRTPATRVAGDSDALQLVLTCGLTRTARPELVLDAAGSLRAGGIHTEVLSLKGGPLEPELRRQAERLGVGFRTRHGSEASWELSPRAVVVLPARSVGLGDELIEAAARSVPAAAISSALGVADAIIPGVTGELALDDDPASLADAVERASRLTVTDVDEWIDRFTPSSSGALLERALNYGYGLASA